MPGNELTLPASYTSHALTRLADLTTVIPPLPSPFSALATTGNTPQQPETLMMKYSDFFSPTLPQPFTTTPYPDMPDALSQPSCSKMEQQAVAEALANALQGREDDDQLAVVKSVLENYPELPAGERGEMGAKFWLHRRFNHSAESMADAFGISKALFYRQLSIISPPPEELLAWVDAYMTQHHPDQRPAELNTLAKVQLTRTYFHNTTPALCASLWKLSALLKISGYSLRNKIKQQLDREASQAAASNPEGELLASALSKTRVHDRSFYQERDKYLQETLNEQFTQHYPGKTIADLTPEERQQLAISYWEEQTAKPSLKRLAELTQTNRRTLVNRIQQIKKVPKKLQQWVEEQLRQLPADIQANYDSDKTLRLDLAMEFWERIPSELHVKKWQLANTMQISPPSLSTRYRRLHLVPDRIVHRVQAELAQHCIALQQPSLSDEEKAQAGAALWLNELSAQIAEKALARQLAIDHQLLHQAINDIRAQTRERVASAKRKAPTPPLPPADLRSVSPEPLTTDSMGQPRKTRENSVKKILKDFGLKAIQALPVSRRKITSNKYVQVTSSPQVKLESITMPPEKGVDLVICGDNGEAINSIATAQRPLTKSFEIRNDLPILRDPENPEKSLTLQAEGVTSAQQLDISYWGDLKAFAKKHPKTDINRIVQQARDLVAMEGPQLAMYIERLMVCHESFAEDAAGALVALGQGVFNNSGQIVAEGTLLGIVAGKFLQGDDASSLARKQGSRNSLSHTWNSGSWENTVNSFHDRNLLSMINSGGLSGKPALADNNVGCFILGQQGNLICYFTTRPVAIGAEYYIAYGKHYDPEILVKHSQREERIENSIERVVNPHQVKAEPGESDNPRQAAAILPLLSPYSAQLISDVYNAQDWRENSSETLMLLLSRTRIFSDNKAVLVVVDEQYQFISAWDSLSNQRLTPQQLTGRKLAVIQQRHRADTGHAIDYHAVVPRAGNENVQFNRYNNRVGYSLAYSFCKKIKIPPSGFSLTHAAWVALTGEVYDFSQGEQLRQQLIDIIQSDDQQLR